MALFWALSVALLAAAASAANSTIESYPSVAQVEFLSITDLETWSQSCAASILTSRYLVSAASCFSGPTYQREFRRIRAGSSYRNTGGALANVELAINYPNWNQTTAYDITVIRLLETLVYGPLISQATIAGSGSVIPVGLPITQVGWGSDNSSEVLSTAALYTVSTSLCGQGDAAVSVDSLLCGVVSESAVYSNADIGGPWFFGNITVGIVAGANSGANNTWTGILSTSVASYTDWIISVAV